MTDTGALQAMLDAFDNAKQGLGIWDENDNLLGFNKLYGDVLAVSYTHLTLPTKRIV